MSDIATTRCRACGIAYDPNETEDNYCVNCVLLDTPVRLEILLNRLATIQERQHEATGTQLYLLDKLHDVTARLATTQEHQLEATRNQAGQLDRLHDVAARIATALEKMADTGLSL